VATENTIADLMGKDASARYAFITENAAEVEELDV
jgi:DNA gyrase/topoisomerase IV subunit B